MNYFLWTVDEKDASGVPRLRPLPGQTGENGEPIYTQLNCTGDKNVRLSHPVGTVFVTTTLVINLNTAKPFYAAGNIIPLHQTGSVVQEEFRKLNAKINAQANEAESAAESQKLEEKAPSANPAHTLLDEVKDKYPSPTIEDDGFYVEKQKWHLIMRNILRKQQFMLTGGTGSGKTTLVMKACSKLGLPLHIHDCGAMTDPVASLLGVHRLKDGKSVFDYASFVEEIQQPGVILLDELSRAANLNLLLPVLDARRELELSVADGDGKYGRRVSVHPDCIFIATANIGSEYTAAGTIDAALSDRFPLQIELDVPDEQHEAEVIVKRTGCSAEAAAVIVKIANTVRGMDPSYRTKVSMRETLLMGELVSDGWHKVKAIQAVLLPKFEGSISDPDSEKSLVNNAIQMY